MRNSTHTKHSASATSTPKKYKILIWVLSIVLPIAVAVLFTVRIPNAPRLGFLPPIYATINGFTAVFLLMAVRAAKQGKRTLHKRLIQICISFSIAFLGMYIAYHITSDSTPYGGEGIKRYLYFFILITHILLSIIMIPLVLISYVRGLTMQIERHRKIARIAFPLWLYVAISGVVVYWMIAPYYPKNNKSNNEAPISIEQIETSK